MASDGPHTRLGTNPHITLPSISGGQIEFGEFLTNGSAHWPPMWRILAHELCSHARHGHTYSGSKGNRPGHDTTIDVENQIAAEHGEPERGKFVNSRQGESLLNVDGDRSKVAFEQTGGLHFESP